MVGFKQRTFIQSEYCVSNRRDIMCAVMLKSLDKIREYFFFILFFTFLAFHCKTRDRHTFKLARERKLFLSFKIIKKICE